MSLPIDTETDSDSNSYLSLKNGYDLPGTWHKYWFDSSRQQMLLFDGLSYWLWAPWVTVGWDKPVFYYKNKKLPSQVSFARISLDSHLIAIQRSPSCVYVVDISSDRQWQVDIKSATDNEILDNGIIWSEHGGNSQDLIILTSRGIELWKVSPARGQCRLSRYISSRLKCFWYEPNFRTLLVGNYQPSSRLNLHKQTIELSGYILNFELSEGPKLELPPPDKIPVFTLGPGVKPEDIYLTSLYGTLYCASYASAEMSSVVRLYSLTKQAVLWKISLSANISGPVIFSTLDNLLCCHYTDFNVSIFYDILDPKHIDAPTPACDENPRKFKMTDPYCPACPITCFEHSANAICDSEQSTFPSPCVNVTASSVWDVVDAKPGVERSCSIEAPVRQSFSAKAKAVDPPLGNSSAPLQHNDNSTAYLQIKQISDLTFCANGSLVFDCKKCRMWKLTCELKAVVATLGPQWRSVDFLARRGQAPLAPKPICGPDLAIGSEAKKVLLSLIKNSLRRKISLDKVRLIFQPLVRIYASEYLRVHRSDNFMADIDSQAYGQVAQAQAVSRVSGANRTNRVKNWLGNFEQRADGSDDEHHSRHLVDEQRIRYSVSGLDSGRRPCEPLEVVVSPHLLRFEIYSALGLGHTFCERISCNDSTVAVAGDTTAPLCRQPDLLIQLNARRDPNGYLLVSQMEMLCHVWIPLLYIWGPEGLVYFSRALAIYIAEIQSVAHEIVVESALSLLLFKILSVSNNHLEAARLMQIQFFTDSVELAVEAFELARAANPASATDSSNVSRVLCQSAFDMLWRLNEITTAVRRLLDLGMVSEAISLCTKSKGTWRRGLSPASIPGVDFYKAGLVAIRAMDEVARKNKNGDNVFDKLELRKCALFSVLFSFLADWDNGLLSRINEVNRCIMSSSFSEDFYV